METFKKIQKTQTLFEEYFNIFSHSLGILLGIAAIITVTINTPTHHPRIFLSCLLYGCTLTLLYFSSVLYHSAYSSPIRRIFKSFDHASIYLLIAGTYTPFLTVCMGGKLGWSLFGIVWSLALIGVIFKCFYAHRFKNASVFLYLAMGWLIIAAIKPFILAMPSGAFLWVLIGGLCYSVGVIFYVLDGRYLLFHFLWHLFVLSGSACHFVAVMRYIVK